MARTSLTLLLLSLLLLSAPISAQEQCGSFVRPEEVEALRLLEESGIYDGSGANPLAGQSLVVPLAFHVVRRTNGTGGLSQSRLNTALADANFAFQNAGISFFQCGPTDYIDDDNYYNSTNTTAEMNALRRTNVVPRSINIYFVPNFIYCGISSFTGSSVQGIIMNNSCTATSSNHSTFPHEIGHYFNLYHTHETAFGQECTSGSNCNTAGDLVCDTPADPVLGGGNVTSSCVYVGGGSGPCSGDPPYSPPTRNYMSYSRSTCRNQFTNQQDNRARSTLVNLRPELLGGCTPPTLFSVNPSSGPVRGGTTITVQGDNFESSANVRFDGQLADVVQRIGNSQIIVRTPEGATENQIADVSIHQSSGEDQLNNSFTYTVNPVAITWTGNPRNGGNITITVYGPAGKRAGLAVGSEGQIVKPCCVFCLGHPVVHFERPSGFVLGPNGKAESQWQVSGAVFETKKIQGVVITDSGPELTNCSSLTIFN